MKRCVIKLSVVALIAIMSSCKENKEPGKPELKEDALAIILEGSCFIESIDAGNTFTVMGTVDTGNHIDYIMYRPADKFKVVSNVILPDVASDHLAVVAVLEIQNNEFE